MVMLAGCGNASSTEVTSTEPPIADTVPVSTEIATEEPPTEPAPIETEENFVYKGDASSYYIDVAYAEQIGRYDTSLSEKGDEGKYFDNDLSAIPFYYYLENVGFVFVDSDKDGCLELIIGAI